MKRIILVFAMLLFVAAGFACPGAFADEPKPAAGKASETVHKCESACKSCATVCKKTLAYCEKKGGPHAEAKHTNTLKDCIQICDMSEDYMQRGSDMMHKACHLCKDSCLKCAESCAEFKGDKTMKECADSCRKCAQSCEKMAD